MYLVGKFSPNLASSTQIVSHRDTVTEQQNARVCGWLVCGCKRRVNYWCGTTLIVCKLLQILLQINLARITRSVNKEGTCKSGMTRGRGRRSSSRGTRRQDKKKGLHVMYIEVTPTLSPSSSESGLWQRSLCKYVESHFN